MSLNLANTVIAFLKDHPDEKFTARQIAEWVFDNFPAECQAKKERSAYLQTDADLVQQLVREVTSHHAKILKTPQSTYAL
jgi:hypothetical protein